MSTPLDKAFISNGYIILNFLKTPDADKA